MPSRGESTITGTVFGTGDSADFDLSGHVAGTPSQIGEYTIESLLGAGGMGRVYRATHRRMERTVALKTLAPERMSDEGAVQRFYSEVRAAARLLHPNIVTAFDAGEIEGAHYLAMEYVEGETLAQLVARRGPLAVVHAVQLIRGAATGLAFAHAAGIVHRDVKPGNIMVAADGTVKVLDLGLATIRHDALEQPTRRGRLLGTFQYIAPEQLEDPDLADARADIYSLGATLHFLLAGRSPYEGEMLDQLRQHREGPVPDLFHVRQDVDLRLNHIFQRMMAKRPQDRYSTLDETLEDLNSWLAAGGTPEWLAGLQPTISGSETPTASGDPSTMTTVHMAMGIDFGMTHLATAVSDPTGLVEATAAGGPSQAVMRAALASHEGVLSYGEPAMTHRIERPQVLVHSAQLYLGKSRVDRHVMGRQCPPEVVMGLLLRHVRHQGWSRKGRPSVAAITVPGCYDQFRRRGVLQAAQLAGFSSVRLIDRGLAAGQSQLHAGLAAAPIPAPSDVQHWLVCSLTGLGTEATVLRHVGGRVETIATRGSWLIGTLTWQRRLLELVADQCKRKTGVDPRQRLRDASRLQQACEQAMKDLLLRDEVEMRFRLSGQQVKMPLTRAALAAAGDRVVDGLLESTSQVITEARLEPREITRVLTIGSMTRLAQVRQAIGDLLWGGEAPGAAVPPRELTPIDRRTLAQGAALAAAAELPGRDAIARPPQGATTYDLGLLAFLGGGDKPSAFPVIPAGTALPARTGRRLTLPSQGRGPAAITIVESAGKIGAPWRSLGMHPLPETPDEVSWEVIFEVNIDGLLTLRLRNAASGETRRLETIPAPTLSAEDQRHWRNWLEETVLTQ
jgi:hypothetical protein